MKREPESEAKRWLLQAKHDLDDANFSFKNIKKRAATLDIYYIPTRYPNGLPGGIPTEALDLIKAIFFNAKVGKEKIEGEVDREVEKELREVDREVEKELEEVDREARNLTEELENDIRYDKNDQRILRYV